MSLFNHRPLFILTAQQGDNAITLEKRSDEARWRFKLNNNMGSIISFKVSDRAVRNFPSTLYLTDYLLKFKDGDITVTRDASTDTFIFSFLKPSDLIPVEVVIYGELLAEFSKVVRKHFHDSRDTTSPRMELYVE